MKGGVSCQSRRMTRGTLSGIAVGQRGSETGMTETYTRKRALAIKNQLTAWKNTFEMLELTSNTKVVAEKTFTNNLPADVIDRFQAWAEANAVVHKRALEAAMGLIAQLPPHVLQVVLSRDLDRIQAYLASVTWPPVTQTGSPHAQPLHYKAGSTDEAAQRALEKARQWADPGLRTPAPPASTTGPAGRRKKSG